MRSLEWLSTIRYALAINKSFLVDGLDGSEGSEEIKQFKAVNRAFAVLEPGSKGVIGSRMFYIVNFLGCFQAGPDGGALKELAGRLMEDIVVKCFRGGEGDRGGFGGDLRRVLSGGDGDGHEMEVDSVDELMEEGMSVGEMAGRFLMAVLGRMVREVGLEVPLGVVLMGDIHGVGDAVGEWKPRGMRGGTMAGCAWRSCLLSPEPPSSNTKEDTGVELLEHGIWLAGYGDDLKAEVKFRALIDQAKTGSSPSPKMAAEMKVLARCSHYQLASIYWRRGEKMAAKEELQLAVKASVLYDHFVQWGDVDFLYV